MPFEITYLPLLQWVVAAFSVVTGLSAAKSFHIVTAGFYVLGPLTAFWMALVLSRKLAASFIGALAYSLISVSNLIIPDMRLDAGGALTLRRLHVLISYGAAPQVAALALLPIAIICFHRALTTRGARWKLLAGISSAIVVLTNAFGAAMLVIAILCRLMAFQPRPWWKALLAVGAIGTASYCWISPWLSPRMIRAIRDNSFTSGGDYRYTAETWLALTIIVAGYVLILSLMLRWRVPTHVRFFVLLGYLPTAFVVLWYAWHVAVIPQPSRYHLELDLALLLGIVFGGAALLDRFSRNFQKVVAVSLLAILAFQIVHSVPYARRMIRSVDPALLSEYKVAQWMDKNRPGQRAFITGSSSFWYNLFTDNPQLHGGHEQHAANRFIPIVAFTVYSGTNVGARDAEYSELWLKAFGAQAVSVSGPNSTEVYKPVNPDKFEGFLPLLWREGDDAIYEVPARSASLAHVMPAEAIPSRTPIHGLDIEPVEPYVAALDNPDYPLATFEWKNMNEAEIDAIIEPGQVIAVQITFDRGWEAYANGRRQAIRGDAIGQMVIEPDCVGPCRVSLRYTGGSESILTRALSVSAMLFALGFVWFSRRRSPPVR